MKAAFNVASPEEKEEAACRPLLLPPPPSGGIQSRLPASPDVMRALLRILVALCTCVLLIWLVLFICMCILLSRANTPDVRASCAGFFDFMLCVTVAPVILPCIYCCAFLVFCTAHGWRFFYGGASLVLAVLCLHMSLTAGENASCVDALRRTTEPLPLLLYAGYLKACLFLTAALSSLCSTVPWSG